MSSSIFSNKKKPISKKILSVTNPNAPFNYVEAYKMLCTNLEFVAAAENCKSIGITSSLADEGKTNIMLNLALTLSGYGKKVCLVEGDLRRPVIHRFFDAPHNIKGITNVLTGQAELHDAIKKVKEIGLSILFAGSCPPNPSELLASERMRKLVDTLEKEYDYVIYDTPPAYVVTDAAALGKYLDGMVLIIRHDSTEKAVVNKAKKNLETAGVKLLGAIYSQYNPKASGVSLNYDYYYYSSQSGSNQKSNSYEDINVGEA